MYVDVYSCICVHTYKGSMCVYNIKRVGSGKKFHKITISSLPEYNYTLCSVVNFLLFFFSFHMNMYVFTYIYFIEYLYSLYIFIRMFFCLLLDFLEQF